MKISDIPVPEIYKDSADFRFFLKWFEYSLSQIKYDTENLFDLYDPQRCPSNLLWLLADTMGYKLDDRLPVAFNRLVLLYFMSMIYSKGSKNGVTLAAEVNLAQLSLINYGKEDEILFDRLEDTSIPVNSVYVTPHVVEGYIDVVYFSTQVPIDTCIEYVRPIGMYCFQHAGVRVDARTKISVDARLTNTNDLAISIGATHVGHYRRDDYASMQMMSDEVNHIVNPYDQRHNVWYRNSEAEGEAKPYYNPGLNSLYSLQLSNNEHIMESLIPECKEPIFSIGMGPKDVTVKYPDDYLSPKYKDDPMFNLRYDKHKENAITSDLYTADNDRTSSVIDVKPAVNPVMYTVGDAVSANDNNTVYSEAGHRERPIVKEK